MLRLSKHTFFIIIIEIKYIYALIRKNDVYQQHAFLIVMNFLMMKSITHATDNQL